MRGYVQQLNTQKSEMPKTLRVQIQPTPSVQSLVVNMDSSIGKKHRRAQSTVEESSMVLLSCPESSRSETCSLQLRDLFLSILDIQLQLEFARHKLAQQTKFNLYETFRFFDKDLKGVISAEEFNECLGELLNSQMQQFSHKHVLSAFSRLNYSKTGLLSFSEMSRALI